MSGFIVSAEQNSRVDLLRYIEDVYKACPPGSNLYMGCNELCSLARDPDLPTQPFCANGHREPRAKSGSRGSLASGEPPRGACASLCACCSRGGRTPARPATRRSSASSVSSSVDNPLHAAQPSSARTLGSSSSSASLRAEEDAEKRLKDGDRSSSAASLTILHGERCLAWQLVHAYYALRDVTCLGPTDRHQFWGDSVRNGKGDGNEKNASSITATWNVVKVNRSNIAQRRIMSIEKEKGMYILTTRDMHMRLKRRIPVGQIVQTEASLSDVKRCQLYIEAEAGDSGSKGWDSYLAITQDTVFDLVFPSGLDRDSFLDKLVTYREELLRQERGLLEAAMGGAVAADAAQKLVSQRLNLKTESGRPSTGPGATLAAFTSMRFSGGRAVVPGLSLEATKEAVARASVSLGRGGHGGAALSTLAASHGYSHSADDESSEMMSQGSSTSRLASASTSSRNLLGAHGGHGGHGHEGAFERPRGPFPPHLGSLGASESSLYGSPHFTRGTGERHFIGRSDGDEESDEDNPHGGRALLHSSSSRRSAMKGLLRRTGTLEMVERSKSMHAMGIRSASADSRVGGLSTLAAGTGLSSVAALAALRRRDAPHAEVAVPGAAFRVQEGDGGPPSPRASHGPSAAGGGSARGSALGSPGSRQSLAFKLMQAAQAAEAAAAVDEAHVAVQDALSREGEAVWGDHDSEEEGEEHGSDYEGGNGPPLEWEMRRERSVRFADER